MRENHWTWWQWWQPQAAFLVPPLKSCWSPPAVVCSGGEGAVGDRIHPGGCRWSENVGRIPENIMEKIVVSRQLCKGYPQLFDFLTQERPYRKFTWFWMDLSVQLFWISYIRIWYVYIRIYIYIYIPWLMHTCFPKTIATSQYPYNLARWCYIHTLAHVGVILSCERRYAATVTAKIYCRQTTLFAVLVDGFNNLKHWTDDGFDNWWQAKGVITASKIS